MDKIEIGNRKTIWIINDYDMVLKVRVAGFEKGGVYYTPYSIKQKFGKSFQQFAYFSSCFTTEIKAINAAINRLQERIDRLKAQKIVSRINRKSKSKRSVKI